jgi:hypothetical protein
MNDFTPAPNRLRPERLSAGISHPDGLHATAGIERSEYLGRIDVHGPSDSSSSVTLPGLAGTDTVHGDAAMSSRSR